MSENINIDDLGSKDDMMVSDDDRLWALLGYIFSPLVPIIILLMEDKKDRPFIKAHNMQALVLGAVSLLIGTFLGWLVFPLCLNLGIFVYSIYCGLQAYKGEMINIPVITDFVKGQGWA